MTQNVHVIVEGESHTNHSGGHDDDDDDGDDGRLHVLLVPAQPVLLKQQKVHKRAYEGESIILSCNPPESSTPPVIHWMDKREYRAPPSLPRPFR